MSLGFLDRFRPKPVLAGRPVFDGLAQVRAYWEGLRVQGRLPQRSQIDPRGLSGMLDRVFFAERIGTGLAQIRIAGSGLTDLAGTDLRGLPLSCLFTAESRPLLAQSLERAFTEPAVVELDLGSDRGAQGRAIARLVLLPVVDGRGETVLLGALGLASGPFHSCKFQLLARLEERVALALGGKPSAEVVSLAALFAPEEDPQPVKRRGHLSLVHSAD